MLKLYDFNFIIPTHKINYIDNLKPKNWFCFWDLVGRAFVAFGIYTKQFKHLENIRDKGCVIAQKVT